MSDRLRWSDEASVEVAAPAERVWDVIADLGRIGERSPVCRRCEWIGGATGPELGARFVGHNRLRGVRWSRECEVTEAERGQAFAFRTFFRGEESTRWRYQLDPVAGGTRVTESYEVVTIPPWLRAIYRLPGTVAKARRDGIWNMTTTLAAVKRAAEAGEAAPPT